MIELVNFYVELVRVAMAQKLSTSPLLVYSYKQFTYRRSSPIADWFIADFAHRGFLDGFKSSHIAVYFLYIAVFLTSKIQKLKVNIP